MLLDIVSIRPKSGKQFPLLVINMCLTFLSSICVNNDSIKEVRDNFSCDSLIDQTLFSKLSPIMSVCTGTDSNRTWGWENAFGKLVCAVIAHSPKLCLSFSSSLLRSLMDVVKARTVHAADILQAVMNAVKVVQF